jgi:hypothetical protein
LSITCYGGVDETGIDSANSFVIHGVLFQRAGEVVFNEDITFCHELMQNIHAFFVLERETNRLFVSIRLGQQQRMSMAVEGTVAWGKGQRWGQLLAYTEEIRSLSQAVHI